jgi:hypothetical protein
MSFYNTFSKQTTFKLHIGFIFLFAVAVAYLYFINVPIALSQTGESCLTSSTQIERATPSRISYNLTNEKGIDARNIEWIRFTTGNGLEVNGLGTSCFSGGEIDNLLPFDAYYECSSEHGYTGGTCVPYHQGSSGMAPNVSGKFIVEDLMIANIGDGISLESSATDVISRRVYMLNVHDDAFEGDFGKASWTIEDSLIDRAHLVFAMRLRSGASGNQTTKQWTIRNTLARTSDFPHGYKDPTKASQFQGLYKLDDSSNNPEFYLFDNTFLIGEPTDRGIPGSIFPPLERVKGCSGNTIYYGRSQSEWDNNFKSEMDALNTKFPGCHKVIVRPSSQSYSAFVSQYWDPLVNNWKESHVAGGGTTSTTPTTPPDTTPPSVSISSPSAGATVSGTITISGSAQDTSGIVGVSFFVNGTAIGSEDTSSPYSASLLTTTLSNGQHTISAKARDTKGNTNTTSITVNVSNIMTTPGETEGVVFVGAGDIALEGGAQEATAKLLDSIVVGNPTAVVYTLGDNAYPDGRTSDFANYYQSTWGRHWARTKPSPGNHEYHVSGGADYLTYFCPSSSNCVFPGGTKKKYYSYDVGDWHIISLNSEEDYAANSAQLAWLKNDLSATSKSCILAYWHKPLFSSSSKHGSNSSMKPFWDALYAAGADVVLGSHDHLYERFAKLNPSGALDSKGIREFIVGTGGSSLYDFGTPLTGSEVRNNTTHGVLKFVLGTGKYTWQFVPVAGETFTDSGSGTCNDGPNTQSGGGGTTIPDPSTKFAIGNRVQTTDTVNVRQVAGTSGNLLGTQPLNTLGTVTAGPSYAGGLWWWNINFDSGVDGWAAEDYLKKASVVTLPSPTADIRANGNDGPIGILSGSSVTLSWTSTNTSSCTVTPTGWTGTTNSGRATTITTNTTYTISCTGDGGTVSDSVSVFVTVPTDAPDVVPPSLSITGPSSGEVLSGIVTISATAQDASGIAGVTFFINGSVVGTEDTTSPYSAKLVTTSLENKQHIISAKARDTKGNTNTTSVTVSVSNSAGGGTTDPGSQNQGGTLIFTPVADATINAKYPSTNYGTRTKLEVDEDPRQQAFMKFIVSGIGTQNVQSVKLRLYNENDSAQGGNIYKIPEISWTETGITWETRPQKEEFRVGTIGPVVEDEWYEIELTQAIQKDGTYAFKIISGSGDGADYASREAGERSPQLIVKVSESTAPGVSTAHFKPIADATLKSGNASQNYGENKTLQLDAKSSGSPTHKFIMKFSLSELSGKKIKSAKIRIKNINSSGKGGNFHISENNWSEKEVTWNSAPKEGTLITSLGKVSSGKWYEFDVTSFVKGAGEITIMGITTGSDGADYASRESSNSPELIVTY